MSRKYRAWKSDMKMAHMWGLCLDSKITLASYKKQRRRIETLQKRMRKIRIKFKGDEYYVELGKLLYGKHWRKKWDS